MHMLLTASYPLSHGGMGGLSLRCWVDFNSAELPLILKECHYIPDSLQMQSLSFRQKAPEIDEKGRC